MTPALEDHPAAPHELFVVQCKKRQHVRDCFWEAMELSKAKTPVHQSVRFKRFMKEMEAYERGGSLI